MFRKALPYVLSVLGLATVAATRLASFPLSGWPRDAVALAGGLVAIGAGIWIDYVRTGKLTQGDRRQKAVQGANLLGLVLFLSLMFDFGFSTAVKFGLGAVGLAFLLGTAYWVNRMDLRTEYDERELEIRYRAAYNGFLVVNGVLITAVFVLFALSTPAGEEVTAATGAMVGALVTMGVGVLAFKASEGWYSTRM